MNGTAPTVPIIGFAKIERRPLLGIVPNEAHQPDQGFVAQNTYEIAVVEFDDQGRCYSGREQEDGSRRQLDQVADRLDAMREQREDVILLAFVHGWKHDARSDDPNLRSFCWVLERTAEHERRSATGNPRPVMGVYVGWRGLSAHGLAGIAEDSTFWGRQQAANRVATGSVRELFGRLRHYRNSRIKHGGSPLLVVAGHSFGGMIVFSALAQSLIEAASAPTAQFIPGFADLVVLANPAIEGARYLPIHDLVTSDRFKKRSGDQLPVFVCIQAENDQPVGTWFPIGNLTNRLKEAVIGDLEKRCVTHAIGFVDAFRTHRVSGPAGPDPFVLDPPATRQRNPFWVVAATKDVVNGHGGIWMPPFLSFLGALICKHVNMSRSEGDREPAETAPPRKTLVAEAAGQRGTVGDDLADFARGMGTREQST